MSQPKRPLAFLLGISENLGFAAGNVALSLHKYMAKEDYDVLIYYSTINSRDRAALDKIARVQLVPFAFDAHFSNLMLTRLPRNSRFRNIHSLMCLCHFEAFDLLSRYSTVVWLDADLAIQGDVRDIVTFKPLGITSDTPWTVQQNFTQPVAGYNMKASGWCTAVMVVHDDLPYKDLHEWCYKKAIEYAEILVNPDQGIINLAFEHFHITPREMPYQIWQCVPWREQASTARIVHFGSHRKVWSDSNVLSAFPEWYRLHLEWLRLGGRDFDRRGVHVKNPLTSFDDLDTRTGNVVPYWSAPTSGSALDGFRARFAIGARRAYLRMRLHEAPLGSVRRASHELVAALCRKTGIIRRLPALPSSDRPDVAFRLRGGLGDHLIAAQYLRDLSEAVGGLEFDLFSSRPELASWIFKNIPHLNKVYSENIVWDLSRSEYSLPIHLQQYVYLYLDEIDCRKALENNSALARICESIERNRGLIADHIVGQPHTDHVMALQAVLRGWNRYNVAHNMSGLTHGGHRLRLNTDPSALAKYGLAHGPYITIHNASDENFLVAGAPMGDRQSTKIYPHFGRVVELLRNRIPAIKIVHLGGRNSHPIPGVDLDLRGKCSIQQTAAILANSRFHLDVESGLVHLAASLGVRSCVLFGPTNLDYFAYDDNINVPPASCGNCWWLTRDWMMTCAKGYEKQKCLDDIRPVTVIEALAPTLQKIFSADDIADSELLERAS